MAQEVKQPDVPALTAADVSAWLLAHPDFLAQHPDLLGRLALPPRDRGEGVIDLQGYQAERLRGQVDRLKDQQRAFIGASRANHNTQNRVHAAILFLLDAESFEQLIHTVSTDLAVLLDLDVVTLLVEAAEGEESPPHSAEVRIVGPGEIGRRLGAQELLLESDMAGEEALFGAGAGLVRSQALIRLNVSPEVPPCVLALGSRDPEMFHPGMRTELVGFLGRVLERCIRSWLSGPGQD
ncbi:MAG TPA: DUF484 family protein [Inquilinus sp.]